jgi:hypothetical protein
MSTTYIGMLKQYISVFVFILQGARVWLPDETDVWVSGEICHDLDGNLLSVQVDTGEVM